MADSTPRPADRDDPFTRGAAVATHSRVEIVGSGPIRVLAAHGWTTDARVFAPWIPYLDTSRFTVAFVEARGYGAARAEAGAHSIPEYGEDLLRVAADLGWDEFSLVGHSMGGKAIQYALALAPRQVKCLVGVTPVPASGSPMPDEVIGLFRAAVTDADSRRTIFDMSTGHRRDDAWLDAQVAASMVASNPEANRSYLDSWTTGNFADRVAGIDVPVLVVVGKHDGGITAVSSQETWGPLYPNLTITEIDGAGHYPIGETPAEFAAIVGDFLASHG